MQNNFFTQKFPRGILAALAFTLAAIQPSLAYAAHGLYTSVLTGGQEVPPTTSTATGSGTLSLAGSTVTCSGTAIGLSAELTGAHIHQGAPGTNGPIILTLIPNPTVTIPPNFPRSFNCPAGASLTAAQIADLDAGNLYFNVHTTAFPGGEIRGQILHAPPTVVAPIPTLSQWGLMFLSLLLPMSWWVGRKKSV